MDNTKKKELIVQSIQQLDVKQLATLLDADGVYFNLPKDAFLQKIGDIFDDVKMFGDTFMAIYEGSCTNCYAGCKGYRFVAKKSEKYMDFVFPENKDKQLDIVCCRVLKSEKHLAKKYTELYIVVQEEEKAEFLQSKELVQLNERCTRAVKDIRAYGSQEISQAIYKDWCFRCVKLEEDLSQCRFPSTRAYSDFTTIIDFSLRLMECLDNKEKCNGAINEFEKLNPSDKNEIASWLTKYDALTDLLLTRTAKRLIFDEGAHVIIFGAKCFVPDRSEFAEIDRFLDLYEKYKQN